MIENAHRQVITPMSNPLLRPDQGRAKAVLGAAEGLWWHLSGILDSRRAAQDDIARHAQDLLHKSAMAELGKLDIDTLNAAKQGIRVSALRKAGVQHLGQLYGLSLGRITHIDGIGEQTALKIKATVDAAYSAVRATCGVHIDIQAQTPQQNALLLGLFVLLRGDTLFAQAEYMLESGAAIPSALKEAARTVKGLKWMFSGRGSKTAAVNAFEYLAAMVEGPFGQNARALIDAFGGLARPTKQAVYADFEQSAAAYYARLEQLKLIPALDAPASGLPQEIVALIEQYPLDLRHLRATLRGYQTFGAKYVLQQRMALLGDEMGLGKTVQALAVIADLKARGKTHFLVVCPAGVLVNWKREVDKHTDLTSVVIHGHDKEDELNIWRDEVDIGITNYETITRLAGQIDFPVSALVVDEAHFVKNPQAQRTAALLYVARQSELVLYMTGTPLENRVDEMCFLMGCLRPDVADRVRSMKALSATAQFRQEIAPVYLRRLRADVLSELPDLIESADWLEPTNYDLMAYSAAVSAGNFMAMRRISWDIDLRQSAKAARLLELCEDALEDGRKVIVFSFFISTLNAVAQLLGARAIGPITGSVSNEARQRLIDDFTAAPLGAVLVAQVQAGGVGLNIQAASMVIFCEPQIKPSLESQAISRAYRMGQVRDVQVHRLLCENTVDEHMMTILDAKQTEFDIYAEESAAGAASLENAATSAWISEVIRQEQAKLRPEAQQV